MGGSLPDSGGTLRLIKRSGAVILELDYDDDSPWPVAADGAGHSLVLSRASYGETDPRGLVQKRQDRWITGGREVSASSALDHVLINETARQSESALTPISSNCTTAVSLKSTFPDAS